MHHLMGIKALDVVGADFDVLLDDEEPPGEVAQDQPGQGDGQLSQAAEPVGRAQPGQGQAAARSRVAARGGPSYLHQAIPARQQAARVRLPRGAASASQR